MNRIALLTIVCICFSLLSSAQAKNDSIYKLPQKNHYLYQKVKLSHNDLVVSDIVPSNMKAYPVMGKAKANQRVGRFFVFSAALSALIGAYNTSENGDIYAPLVISGISTGVAIITLIKSRELAREAVDLYNDEIGDITQDTAGIHLHFGTTNSGIGITFNF